MSNAAGRCDGEPMDVTVAAHRLPGLPPNFYAMPFGIAGLAVTWRTAQSTIGLPAAIADVLFVAAAALWVALTVDLVARIVRAPAEIGRETADPVRSPFFALPAIVALLLAVGLLPHAPALARAIIVAGVVVVVPLGGWLTGQWIAAGVDRERFHPGYLLPAVAGGLVAANAAALAGYRTLGWLLFGIGLVSWMQIGPTILGRLFFAARLPVELRPTLAIEVAPPAVAGNAYFALHQGPNDVVTYVLAGYCVLMIVAQLRLIGVYRQLSFGAPFWAFAFSYTTVATYALRWLEHTGAGGDRVLSWSVLGLITALIAFIGVRSLLAAAEGRFFPSRPELELVT